MKYNVIYADVPWSYSDKACAGKRGVEFKYPCMNISEIKDLHVNNIANENCALFLWCTWPQMPQGLDVIKAWGFKYKTIGFVWVKRNKRTKSLFWGMGHYSRANTEFCLLGIKGRMKRMSAGVHSVIDTSIEKHSQKPAIVRDKIVELFGDIPRIELFAREVLKGWDAIGVDITHNDIRTDLNTIIEG